MRLLTYTLGPWRIRWRDALWSDPDIFPDRRLRPNFPTEALRQVDLKTQTEAEHHRRQAGVMTANEIRRPLGLPDHPDGDELQATPVGGAPNPGAPSILLPGEKKPEGDE